MAESMSMAQGGEGTLRFAPQRFGGSSGWSVTSTGVSGYDYGTIQYSAGATWRWYPSGLVISVGASELRQLADFIAGIQGQ